MKTAFTLIVFPILSILFILNYLKSTYLISNPVRVVIFTGNVVDHQVTQSVKQPCEYPVRQLSGNRTSPHPIPVMSTHLNTSVSGIWTLGEVLTLNGFIAPPNLHSSSHPFNKPFYLKSFIGHLYRKYIKDTSNETHSTLVTDTLMNYREYKFLLSDIADENKTIIITTVDLAYVNMAINMFETSFRKFNITNYIFACSHPKATELLISIGINAITLWFDYQGNETSDYSSKAFNRKTGYKTLATAIALSLGFNVLLTDVDVIFLKSPFPFLTCDFCDIIFQSEGDESNVNTGFYMAFPTNNSMKLHLLALDSYKLSKVFNDQDAIQQIVDDMRSNDELQVKVINPKLFPNGIRYFDDGCRMFAGENLCRECAIVHNNDIISYSNKVYRFKEHLMWTLDTNGYYSNETAKYITFGNTIQFQTDTETRKAEIESLKTAFLIGDILGRIVILPRFHCPEPVSKRCTKLGCPTWCNVQVHLNMATVDRELSLKYREHTFLNHPKVPKTVKHSVSEMILVKTYITNSINDTDFKMIKRVFTPKDSSRGASQEEFAAWMKKYEKYSVLRFHSLCGNVINPTESLVFNFKLRELH